jgi:hypothetical protein
MTDNQQWNNKYCREITGELKELEGISLRLGGIKWKIKYRTHNITNLAT